MDLSGLKWPLIIAAVVGIGWLASSGGVSWMQSNFTKHEVGADPERDKLDEAGLSRLATYVLYLWKYEKAKELMELAIDRYGDQGANYWFNVYRLSTCNERLGNYEKAVEDIDYLIQNNAETMDDRVPTNDNLALKAAKIREVNELPGAI
jgi:tetratricopeptide (TPR) repeat protein